MQSQNKNIISQNIKDFYHLIRKENFAGMRTLSINS